MQMQTSQQLQTQEPPNQRAPLFPRSLSKTDLKNRLYEIGPSKRQSSQAKLSSLPSVVNNSKGRPMRGKGLEFLPPRQNINMGDSKVAKSQHLIVMNKKQSAFLAGASKIVIDPFTSDEIKLLEKQRERMFQSIEDVQMADNVELDEDDRSLHMQIPSATMLQFGKSHHAVAEWGNQITDQFNRFKNSQHKKLYPNINSESLKQLTESRTLQKSTTAAVLTTVQSQAQLLQQNPQFQQINLGPYIRPATTFESQSHRQQTTLPLRQLVGSQSIKSLTGMEMRAPLAPKTSTLQTHIAPHMVGQIPGSSRQPLQKLTQSQSEAFFKERNTQHSNKTQLLKPLPFSTKESESSKFMQKNLIKNERIQPEKLPGQSEAAEEKLRQHYYIARATKRTSLQTLEKPQSPMKHIAGQERIEQLESIQIQTASLMRLNSVWGLEKKEPPVDFFKAAIDPSITSGGGVLTNVLPQHNKLKETESLSDLDMMISLFMRQPEDNGYFIYLQAGQDSVLNPFDLKPMIDYVRPSFDNENKKKYKNQLSSLELQTETYYTLSKKGITLYYKGQPQDYESLQDWILARSNFQRISNYSFFKNFRRWKIMKMWYRNIIHKKRDEIKQILQDKLFLLDDTFGPIIMKHRRNCIQMESIRVLTLVTPGVDVANLAEFLASQEKQRLAISKVIQEKSVSSRNLFDNGMKEVLNNLKKKVHDLNDEEDQVTLEIKKSKEAAGNMPEQTESSSYNPALAAIGFPSKLKYGTRSELRKNCSRFLRFSYLMDFLATEALTNIQLQTIQETIEKLQVLSKVPVDYQFKINKNPEDDIKRTESAPLVSSRSMVSYDGGVTFQPQILPFLQVSGRFNDLIVLKTRLQKRYIDPYQPPPLGKSTLDDFNPTVHLKIADNKQDEENQEDLALQEFNNQTDKVEAYYVEHPDRLWLSVEPSAQKLQQIFQDCLIDGKTCLRIYKRWSRHPDLNKYQAVLETWDDRVCDTWEPLAEDRMHLNCEEWLLESDLYQQHTAVINDLIGQAYSNIDMFYQQYVHYLQLYWENKMCGNYEILSNEKLHNPVESIQLLLNKLSQQKQVFEDCLPEVKDLGMLRIDVTAIKLKMTPQPKLCIQILKDLIPEVVKLRINQSSEWLRNQIVALKTPTNTVESFVQQIQTLEYIDLSYQEVKDRIELNAQIFNICGNYELIGREERHRRFIQEAFNLIYQLNKEISFAREMADRRKQQIKERISLKVPKLNKVTQEFLEELEDVKYLDIGSNMEQTLSDISNNEVTYKLIIHKKQRIQNYQRKLDMSEISQFENVELAQHNYVQRAKLWRALNEWTKLVEQWENTIFSEIDVPKISQISDQYQKTVIQCERNLPPQSSAVQQLKNLVLAFKNTMPIVEALGNRNLQEYHWQEIKSLLQLPADFHIEERQFSLGRLIELRVDRKQEEIINISVTATQEYNLQTSITEIKNLWNVQEFDVIKHKDKDAYKLTGIDVIQTILDESLSKVSDIQSNRYVKRLAQSVEELQERLIVMSETIEQWKECQRNWLYLENIFSSSDIRKQRAKDYADFDAVNRQWNNLMKKVAVKRIVKANCNPHRLQEFIKYNQAMEKIVKNLDVFLEEKRSEFPRFYFISNDELLQLLAHQQELHEVNRHLNKCFDNLKKIGIADNTSTISEILSMISSEDEIVEFLRPIKLRNSSIEIWLKQVEEEMIKTLTRKIRDTYSMQSKGGISKKELVLKQCGQGVSVSSMVVWTELTEYAITEMEENPFALSELLKQQQDELKGLVDLIRQNITTIQRRILVSLITAEVHSRDILNELVNEGTDSIYDFKWLQQLKYYQEEDQVVVRQVNATLAYGYEYMGATSRLVITPLTDRCWLTITGALYIKLGASPAGPAGTGKTESTKDLAKALGIQCVVFNCSEQVEYKIMGRLFSGLAQSGSWACLDEFNRIDVEVLSVIAQQLLDIRQAKLANKTTFNFNDRLNMPLKQSCGVFVTMNPGYAGRTELPDNLKVLFRPVSMMIPSYGLIAEVMLFAEGFTDAKRLSAKMVKLYKLASEQLSQQDHYDFGMRAVKSVLVMAGNLKRENPNFSENVVLIKAMRDSNIPKFLADDLPLFQALIQDLFPGVEIQKNTSKELDSQIQLSIEEMQLMQLDTFSQKVVQLYDTLLVRFGVMIVGPSDGGKTTCYQVLSNSLTQLSQKKPSYHPIKTKVLNPKSVTMGELYGQENIDTKEWTDGLASKIMRKFANASDNRRYWVVFDGPVDAIWIENMNTVLDDNMTLCLASGERIKLRQEMRLIFEVQDLAVASPATVSRCGMVYMTPQNLGWKPYQVSWFKKYLLKYGKAEAVLSQDKIDLLNELFDQFLEEGLARLEQYSQDQQLPCQPVQIVRNICSYLEYFIENKVNHPKNENKDTWFKYLNAIFGYSMIWSIGAHYKANVNRFLDNMLRDFFSRLLIPLNDSVFEYYFDEQKLQFIHWKEIVPTFTYPSVPTPFFQLVVPTVDTTRYSTHLKMLTKISKPVFITGETGTGKSMIVQDFISANSEAMEFISINLYFSAQTDSFSTQNNIESKLEKKRKKSRGAKGTLKTLIFVDDINMPEVEKYGAQPPIELLRQLLDTRGFYDRQQFFWKEIEKFTLVCAAAPPGGGRSHLSQRFMKHFMIFNVNDADEETLTVIFESILGGFLQQNMFSEKIRRNQPMVAVSATIDLYLQITKTLLPIPAKFHYTFNLRDISKVFQGILLSNPISCQDNESFSKLWLHECSRVFGDRLMAEDDREFFQDLTFEILLQKFKAQWAQKKEEVLQNQPIFTVIMKLDHEIQTYDLVNDKAILLRTLQDKLTDYNFASASKMNLVFFEDALISLCAITRILQQPRGNAMLIGVSGSGKQSLTKLAASMLEHKSFQLQLSKNFKQSDFRETIRIKMLSAGCDSHKTTFVLTDTQIMYESFLEDVNNILNTGEITNLYLKEDYERMSEALTSTLAKLKIPQNKDNIYIEYIKQLRNNFHSILCMSPVGDQLRIRCRMFPSLVNCCTLIWFSKWPIEALTSVANQYLKQTREIPKETLVNLFPKIHSSVEAAAEKFFQVTRRKTYITPKSYLDSIVLYLNLLGNQRQKVLETIQRLENGVFKLHQTNLQIAELQIKLTELKPILDEQESNANTQANIIMEKKQVATQKEIEAENEAAQVRMEAAQIEIIKQEAEQELLEASPALEAANKAVDTLNKEDVFELKAVKNPNQATELALKCVLTYLGYPKVDWASAQRAMTDIGFLQKLKNYDKENIPAPILQKVKAILSDKKEFNVDNIMRSSKAAGGMAKWCVALHKYAETLKLVRPKEIKVAEMQEKFRQAMADVEQKQATASAMKLQVRQMEDELKQTLEYISQLKEDKERCEQRLLNAAKLISLLRDEGARWQVSIKEMQEQGDFIVGDTFLANAEISYLGPFDGQYRGELVKLWKGFCNQSELPISDNYSLMASLGDQVLIRDWVISGLPSDQVSIDNAILSQNTPRWPLMIDPQTQANTWIKKMVNKNQEFLLVLKMTGESQDQLQKKLENAIVTGKQVLLEEIGETIDPGLDSILNKSVYREEGIDKILFGDKSLIYDNRFKFMLTTKIQNPHFLPETCIKLTVINFTVTFAGLEEQMLVDVIKNQAPEVEQRRDDLVIQLATSRNDLYKLQTKILFELASSNSTTILDNVILIETLEICSVESVKIVSSLIEAEHIETTINEIRNKYRLVATRGSILYFSVVELNLIDPMYQNSLVYVKKLFNDALQSVDKENQPNFDSLVKNLLDNITEQLYFKISIGLFEKHKLIFALLICSSIQRQANIIDPKEWSLFIRGPSVDQLVAEKSLNWLTDLQWKQACQVQGLQEHILKNQQKWKEFMSHNLIDSLPLDFDKKISAFGKLLIIKIFKTELTSFAIKNYLRTELGPQFAVNPSSSTKDLFQSADEFTPIIFILSQGVDPTAQVLSYASQNGYQDRLMIKSLGQGQEKIAEKMIQQGIFEGNWILLQNCHLFKSWMGKLETICSEISQKNMTINPEFRLILTSMPAPYFPVSILQNGLKMTTDPPKGIKANLKRTYQSIITQETYDELQIKQSQQLEATQYSENSKLSGSDVLKLQEKRRAWCNLLFSLSFFHALIQERRKFGSHGWNINYEFSEADLQTSITMLKNFLQENEQIPWDSIKFMTGQINYGGRVTDDLDRVLLMNILAIFQNDDIITAERFNFSPSGDYYVPKHNTVEEIVTYIDSLPDDDAPEVFGMQSNANLTYLRSISDQILNTILSVQPRQYSSTQGKSSDEQVTELATILQSQVPDVIQFENFAKEILKPNQQGLLSCLSTVLIQEVQRYNRLVEKLNSSLELLIKAVKGVVLMSQELDLMFTAILNNQVPPNWQSVSYPSLKKLASWMIDLKERVNFMRDWATKGHPKSYWLSGFFFPHGFITGVLQTFSRKYQQPIDQLQLKFEIKEWNSPTEVTTEPKEGVYIYGLYLENARFSKSKKILIEAKPGEMSFMMPLIHFIPKVLGGSRSGLPINSPQQNFSASKITAEAEEDSYSYQCPVYKTSLRAGVLSTTGQSTNFILSVDLPCGSSETSANYNSATTNKYATNQTTASAIIESSAEHWTLRGTALLTMLDD